MDAIFRIDGASATCGREAAGPWSEDMQHGGAPASLVAWAAERLPTLVPMHVTRLTLDLMRPVPVGRLEVDARIVRDGKKIQLCAVSLSAGGAEVVRATALKLRAVDQPLPATAAMPPLDWPQPEAGRQLPPGLRITSPFVADLDIRVIRGEIGQPGPATAWFRVQRPLVEGHANSGLMQAAVVSDFSNGVAAAVDVREWTFINGDVTLYLMRQPVGEWVLLDAQMWPSAEGRAIAFGRLADCTGYFGRATQSVLLERR